MFAKSFSLMNRHGGAAAIGAGVGAGVGASAVHFGLVNATMPAAVAVGAGVGAGTFLAGSLLTEDAQLAEIKAATDAAAEAAAKANAEKKAEKKSA